ERRVVAQELADVPLGPDEVDVDVRARGLGLAHGTPPWTVSLCRRTFATASGISVDVTTPPQRRQAIVTLFPSGSLSLPSSRFSSSSIARRTRSACPSPFAFPA